LLRRNLAANNAATSCTFFNAGLSTRARRENAGGEELNFVDGVPFVIANVPGAVDLLKMDCEGCEYSMLEDDAFSITSRPPRSSWSITKARRASSRS